MDLNEIIVELENYALEADEIKVSAGALQASVFYFFEQLESKKTWTREELAELKNSTQVAKALTMLDKSLRSSGRSSTD